MNLNRKDLRHLILKEMRDLLSEETDTDRFQGLDQNINLMGIEVGGRPHLNGLYRVTSPGSYKEQGGATALEVLQYTDVDTSAADYDASQQGVNHKAVGTQMTLADIAEFNNMEYWEHPLWDQLIAAADTERAEYEAGSAELEGEDVAGEEEVEGTEVYIRPVSVDEPTEIGDELLRREEELYPGETSDREEREVETLMARLGISGGDITLPTVTVSPTILISSLPGTDLSQRQSDYIEKQLNRMLGDLTMELPVSVITRFNVNWGDNPRRAVLASILDQDNQIYPPLLPPRYTNPDSYDYIPQFNEDEEWWDDDEESLRRYLMLRIANNDAPDDEVAGAYNAINTVMGDLSGSNIGRFMDDFAGFTVTFRGEEEEPGVPRRERRRRRGGRGR